MTEPGLRIAKWLWHARFFKSRSLATRHCVQGRLRVNGNRVNKPHAMVRPGDVLTFPKGPHVHVVRIAALGVRRGPASPESHDHWCRAQGCRRQNRFLT